MRSNYANSPSKSPCCAAGSACDRLGPKADIPNNQSGSSVSLLAVCRAAYLMISASLTSSWAECWVGSSTTKKFPVNVTGSPILISAEGFLNCTVNKGARGATRARRSTGAASPQALYGKPEGLKPAVSQLKPGVTIVAASTALPVMDFGPTQRNS